MKRYMLFAGSKFYPRGGIFDLVGLFDTYEEAKEARNKTNMMWAHIYDKETGLLFVGDYYRSFLTGKLEINWQ